MKNLFLAAAAATFLVGCGSSAMPLNPTNASSNSSIRFQIQSHKVKHDVKCWRCLPCFFDASVWNDLSYQNNDCYLQEKHDTALAYMNPEVGPLVYASKFIQSSIVVYAQRGPGLYPVAKISDSVHGPQGLFVDRRGDLYVANTIGQNVLVFHRGSIHAYRVLNDANEWPASVAVDTVGTVYVGNIHNETGGPGSIAVYPPGVDEPARKLTFPNFKIMALAVNKLNDVLVSYMDVAPGSNTHDPLYGSNYRGGRIAEMVHGFTPALSPTSLTWITPGGMQIDAHGRVVVAEQGRVNAPNGGLSVYDLAANTKLSSFGFEEFSPMAEALSGDQQTIWGIDSMLGTLNQYSYPAGVLLRTFGSDSNDEQGVWLGDPPYGVATDPAAQPGPPEATFND